MHTNIHLLRYINTKRRGIEGELERGWGVRGRAKILIQR